MSKDVGSDSHDVVTFSLKLQSSAESFWQLLKSSGDFNVNLSSIEVICNITKFILENDELCRACVTKYTIFSKVFSLSKKEIQSFKNTKNDVAKGSSRRASGKDQIVNIKPENADEESLPKVRFENNSNNDEVNSKENSMGTSELVKQTLLQASDTEDVTFYVNSPASKVIHPKHSNNEKRYACSICRKAFLQPYLIRKHLKKAHKKQESLQNSKQFTIVKSNPLKELFSHACSVCGKKFQEKRYLHNHYKFHIGQKRFACKICNREFLWLCHTRKHVKDVHNKDKTISNVDQYVKRITQLDSYISSSDLNERLQNKEHASFSCDHSDKILNQKHILSMHLLQKHSFGPEIKKIDIKQGKYTNRRFCNKESHLPTSVVNLVSDAISPSNNSSIVASSEVFTENVNDSTQDDQANTEERVCFSCSYCEKCFADKKLVELHIFLTHEQDRLDTLKNETGRYTCPICGKKIGAKRNFKGHLHIHVKERYFICTLCNKSFLWHSCATRHVKTHGVVDVNHYLKMVNSENHSNSKGVDPEQGGLNQRSKLQYDDLSGTLHERSHFDNKKHDFGDINNESAGIEDAEVPADENGACEKLGCTVCSHCCRGFMTHQSWKEHTNVCSVQHQYKCLVCSMPFPSKCSAFRHLRRVHNKESDETDQLVSEVTLHNGTDVQRTNSESLTNSESHFMCSVCKKFFREKRYLRQHMWTHRRQWMHRCKHCARYFTKKQFLQVHINKRHSSGGTRTMKAPVRYDYIAVSSQDLSDSHLCAVCGDTNADITPEGSMCSSCKDIAVEGGTFTCSVCGIKMKNKHDLGVHSRTHEVREHRCDVCGKIYKQKKLLDIHKKEHSGEKPFCCEACGLRFASSERLRFHNYNVHSERLRRNAIKFYASSLCPICDIRVRIKNQMWNHLLIHHGSFELNCNYCDKFFTYTEELSAHGHSLHANTETPFTCYLCETRFSEKARLLEHFRVHPEKEIHFCTQCSTTFYLKADLREHIKSKHERKKRNTVQEQALAGVYRGPFPCKICARVYQKKASLDIHMKIHYGIFDFPCDFCEKKFKSAAECRIHRRQHTKEKPYQCPFCGEKFNRHSTLTQHKRRHTDERPYLCDDCGMAFRTRKTLHNHKLTHTKNAGVPQKSASRAPPKPVPIMNDRNNFILPQQIHQIDLQQQVPVMPDQLEVNHYYTYWNIPRT